MLDLRWYQRKAIDDLYDWFGCEDGNPVLSLPGGSGKSLIIAALCKEALQAWPSTRILMLVHSMELVEQNAIRLRQHWPNAPLGIYSASLNKYQVDQITYAGIQTAWNKTDILGSFDLCLVDEAHAISTKESGTYRKMISDLLSINPQMRVVGFTASPYRLSHGMITEGDEALFNDPIIEPVTIKQLVDEGYLCPLKSKATATRLETSGLHKRGGEFIAKEMQEKFNTDDLNYPVVREIIQRAEGKKHILIFCSGIEHAERIAELFNQFGESARFLSSRTPKSERIQILNDFAQQEFRVLCNVAILTTGYDLPSLDCIVFLRSTASPGLYLQMAVRGMRTHKDKDHCLILDFAGNVERHGPITNVRPPRAGGKGTGEIPVKICPQCFEQVHLSVMNCPDCGYIWEQHKKPLVLSNADIMGQEPEGMEITDWRWSAHTSNRTGKSMLKVRYYGGLSDPAITEYLAITSDGYAGQKAMQTLARIANESEPDPDKRPIDLTQMSDVARWLNSGDKPAYIEYEKNGKFYNVIARRW